MRPLAHFILRELTQIYIPHVPNVPRLDTPYPPVYMSPYARYFTRVLIYKCPMNIPNGTENWKLADNYPKQLSNLFAWFMARS